MQTHTSGKPYRRPIGRYAPHVPVVDHLDASHAVVDLDREHISAADFEIRIMRELKIRFYQPKSRKSYAVVLSGFLRWLGREPATACREDVRAWLELLVDGGVVVLGVGTFVGVAHDVRQTLRSQHHAGVVYAAATVAGSAGVVGGGGAALVGGGAVDEG